LRKNEKRAIIFTMKLFSVIILSLLLVLAFFLPVQASAVTNPGVKPGSFFYFFDTTFEKIGLFFAFSPEKKAEKALEYADERLAEAEAVIENAEAVKTAITNYESNIALATEKSKEVKDRGQAESLLASIQNNSSKNQEILSAVLVKVPEEAREAITQAIEASRRGQKEAAKQIAELKGEVEKLKQEVTELKAKDEERAKIIEELSRQKPESVPIATKPFTPPASVVAPTPKPATPTTPTPIKTISEVTLPNGSVVEMDRNGDIVRTIKEAPINAATKISEELARRNELLEEQNKILQQQTQAIQQIQANTAPAPTPAPVPVPVEPPKDTTPPVFISGPNPFLNGMELSRVEYQTDEPTTATWLYTNDITWQSSPCKPGHPAQPRTTYDCILRVSDKAGNISEKPFSFTTGPGTLGFNGRNTGIYNGDTEPVFLKSITVEISYGLLTAKPNDYSVTKTLSLYQVDGFSNPSLVSSVPLTLNITSTNSGYIQKRQSLVIPLNLTISPSKLIYVQFDTAFENLVDQIRSEDQQFGTGTALGVALSNVDAEPALEWNKQGRLADWNN